MLHYGIKQEEIDGRLWIGSGNDLPITLAEEGKNGRVICEPQLEAIVWTIRELGFDALFIDPFASTHSVSENDNASIQKAATAWKMIAYRCNIAISLAHHTRKPIGNGTATTANDFRGADALVAKARDVRALNSMSKEEANQYGINANESMSYIWIGPGGKSNMSPKTNEKTFYKIISCGLGNGQSLNEPEDRVGVVTQWHPPKIDIRPDPEQLEALKTIMEKRTLWRAAPQSKGEDSIRYAVAEAFGWDMETNRFRINSQIKALTNNKTIERYECHCSRSRKLVPAYRFVTMNVDKGGPDTEE